MWEIRKKKYSYKWYSYSTNDREKCEKFRRKYSTNDREKCEKFRRKGTNLSEMDSSVRKILFRYCIMVPESIDNIYIYIYIYMYSIYYMYDFFLNVFKIGLFISYMNLSLLKYYAYTFIYYTNIFYITTIHLQYINTSSKYSDSVFHTYVWDGANYYSEL